MNGIFGGNTGEHEKADIPFPFNTDVLVAHV
jgi:hypothetical protein